MTRKTICVFGGTGFVGSHLADALTRAGFNVRIPTRHRERYRELTVLPTVDVVNANIYDDQTLANVLRGCVAAVNLVAILNERRRGDFDRVHVELPRRMIAAARKAGVERFIHMSALNASAQRGPSGYLHSKGRGEDYVHAAADKNFNVTTLRPSVIFGPGDHLFNRFANLLRMAPVFFPVVCARARFAPIFVEDVARAIVKCLQEPATASQRIDLCGPQVMTMEQIVAYTNQVTGAKRVLLPLGDTASKWAARALNITGVFTVDNYLSTLVDSVCRDSASSFVDPLTSVEAVVPYYIARHGQRADYDRHRYHARRRPS